MPKVVREPLATIYAQVHRHKILIAILAITAVTLLAVGVDWRVIIFFPALFLAAALSTYYRRIIKVPPAFELVSLTTVVIGVTHGPLWGAIFGATAGLAAEIISGGIDAFVLSYIPGRIVMGIAAGLFAQANIVILGVILVIIYNAIAQSLYLLQGDPEAKLKTAIFVVFNIAINYVLFAFLGEFLAGLLNSQDNLAK